MNKKLDIKKIEAPVRGEAIGINPVTWGFAEIESGPIVIGISDDRLVWLGFAHLDNRESIKQEFLHDWRGVFCRRDDVAVQKWAEKIDRQDTLPITLIGTPFQLMVWQALLSVPSGKTVAYRDIAGKIGHPAACRAVGTAIGANPISLLVPCHRVVRADGKVHNYRWGVDIKQKLLADEGACLVA